MCRLFSVLLVALALSGVVGLASGPALARHSDHCGSHWGHCWKHGRGHPAYRAHWSHRWRDFDQRW
jgi:hypothetical protein